MRLEARLVGKEAEGSDPRPAPVIRLRSTSVLAGRSFARITVLPVLVVIAWLLPGIPLLVAGRFLPVPMVLIAAPLAAFLMVATLRDVPDRWPRSPRPVRRAGTAVAADASADEQAADGLAADGLAADGLAADGGTDADTGLAADGAGADQESDPDGMDMYTAGAAAAAWPSTADSPEGLPAWSAAEARVWAAGGPDAAPDAWPPARDADPYAWPAVREADTDEGPATGDVDPDAGAYAADTQSDAAAPEQDVGVTPEQDVAEGTAAQANGEHAPGEDGEHAPGEDGEHAPDGDAEVAPDGDAEVARRAPRGWAAWWGLGGTVAVAAGFAAWQILLNSPQIIVLRDPGALFQFGYWIAQHGSLPVPQSLAAFGGAHPGLTFFGPGFSQQGVGVVPQYMAGLPMVLAAGFWVHGIAGATFVSPILGAFAILTFGGLAGRLAGPQWSPAAALVLALTLPEQYTSRSAFAEPLVQVLLFGGLCLVIDSLAVDPLTAETPSRMRPFGRGGIRWPDRITAAAAAAIGGFALGLVSLVLLGSLATVAPAILFLAALVAGRRSQAVPFGSGLLIGTGCGLAAGYLLAPSYLHPLGRSLGDLGLIVAEVAVAGALGVVVGWYGPARQQARRFFAARPLRWLPGLAGVLWVAAMIGLAVRPYAQTVRSDASRGTIAYVAALQRLLNLRADPTRLYAEHSLYWVIWYVGAPAVLLGGFGIALLARRCLRALLTWQDADGSARIWALPIMIIGWATLSVLWRPGTVPDQPWASRRLVPVLLPGIILCGIWVSSRLAVRARERGAGPVALFAAGACFVLALALPTALATFGFGLTFAPPESSARSASGGLALNKVGPGQMAAVSSVCGTLSASTTVVILDRVAADQFSQLIRGMCDVPTGVVAGASQADVQAVLSGITSASRRAVLVGSGPAEFAPYGLTPSKVLDLTTTQDAHDLTQPPTSPWQVRYVLWESAPGAALTRS